VNEPGLPQSGLQMRSTLREEGVLELTLERVPVPQPAADEVLIRVEAAPINPSDLGLMFAGMDIARIECSGTGDAGRARLPVSEGGMRALAARLGQSLPVGNEGAGVVVAAGASAQALLGRTVATFGGAMYTQYRIAKAAHCLPMPEGVTPAEAASCFVNPLTALAMVETLRAEGHTALVHTAAASNLGQMLQKICLADGVPLVNVVRKPEQAELLRGIGATHVVDSSAPDFVAALSEAVAATGATLCFDAIGGGPLAGQVLAAMEAAANRRGGEYSRYGSSVHKQVYIYGALDRRPTELSRNFGFAWGVGGFLLTPFLQKAGAEVQARMRARVVAEIRSTFASHYSQVISLGGSLDAAAIAAYGVPTTGNKFLINPALE
jgi:NADPH:quinone reductase-like Zn-dependent oxidoreductase